jgi:hypothetical protein
MAAIPLHTAAAARGAVGLEPPTNALVLFDGRGLEQWCDADGGAARWIVEGDELLVAPGAGDLFTRRDFCDFQLHLEFWLPHMPQASGQDRANSGVYLQGRYELQLLDSFGMEPTDDGCGALYRTAPPLWNACRRPEVWQSLDVAFCCAGDDADAAARGRPRPRLTVFLNGILIHNNLAIPGPTAGAMTSDDAGGPIRLQDHGSAVRFRNVWVVPAGRT